MDFFSHGLWGGIIAKAANKHKITQKPVSVFWFVFWSVIPDFFSFAVLLIWLFYGLLAGTISLAGLPHPNAMEPMSGDTFFIFRFTNFLYNSSHSLIVFFIIFALVSWKKKHSAWVMSGWLIHILIDIPTHSYKFYPTPFLWPLSQWKLDGYSWSHSGFLIFNYLAIFLAYFWLYRRWLKKGKAISDK